MKTSVSALVAGLVVSAAADTAPMLVADYDRDGKIDYADCERARNGERLVVWLNDDDDDDGTGLLSAGAGDTNSDLHDVPGGSEDRDRDDDRVNGRCDLLDFFPVLVDVSSVFGWSACTWKLYGNKKVDVVFTVLGADTAGSFHTRKVTGLDWLKTPLYRAKVIELTSSGETLPDGFLNEGKGVFVFEGENLGFDGITLRGFDGSGKKVAEYTLPLTVANVEDMYRWIDLRGNAKDLSRSGEPAARPDAACDGRHFVLVHGYNTNHEEARGNAAEFFKKLWQSGSDAMFTAVEWHGDQSQMSVDLKLLSVPFSPNYYANVENAFNAAAALKSACDRLPGAKILVGHSLGNMLIASAIKDHGLGYLKYVMLNAAVPREAYDPDAYDEAMIPKGWGGQVDESLRASRWYLNFPDADDYRHGLSWRGRFAGLPRTVNCYSPSDEVLANPAADDPHDPAEAEEDDAGKIAEILSDVVSNSGGFWAFSEKIKGRPTLLRTVNVVLEQGFGMDESDGFECEGGWGRNADYRSGTAFDPANTFFTPFTDSRMVTTGVLSLAASEAAALRAGQLADAIPAESFAAGANPVATLGNVNLESFISNADSWPEYEEPEDGGRRNLWKHSSFRAVAYYFTSGLFDALAAIAPPSALGPEEASDPFVSEDDALEAISSGAVGFSPADEVLAALGGGGAEAIAAYRAMFAPVVRSDGDGWRIRYLLTPAATNELVRSADATVTNLDLSAVAALAPSATTSLTVSGGVPGFRYSLLAGTAPDGLADDGDPRNREVLCGADGKVVFPAVSGPSPFAGFFRTSVR